MDFRELLGKVCEACGWEFEARDEGLVVDVPTGGGRSQYVAVTEDWDVADQAIIRYWSVVGPIEDVAPERLLEENARLCYGAFAYQQGNVVLVDTQLLADADPGEVGMSVTNLAAVADRYEQELYGKDLF